MSRSKHAGTLFANAGASASEWINVTGRFRASAFERAIASASSDTSQAKTSASARSFFQGESDCSAARPDVQNPGRIDVVQTSGCFFHEFFRLGARNQDARCHVDSERKKVGVADDILQRLACQAARQESLKFLLMRFIERDVLIQQQFRPAQAEYVREQPFGVPARVVYGDQFIRCLPKCLPSCDHRWKPVVERAGYFTVHAM